MQTSSIDFDGISEAVREVCRFVRPTRLRPEAFFVARSGVLTLAFSGYTEALIRLKAELEGAIPGIAAENPGSRWPKTTLAALRDGENLDEDDVVRLREATAEGTTCLYRREEPFPVGLLSLVELRDRAMERVGRVESIRLVGPVDYSPVAPRSRASVNAVLSQWRREGLSRYVPDILRSGYRESHYRGAIEELSLVIHVGPAIPCVDVFRNAVESRMPGKYAWLSKTAYHVTVRNLVRI